MRTQKDQLYRKDCKKIGLFYSGLSSVSGNDFEVIYTKWEKSM